jgi:hypothetical protein
MHYIKVLFSLATGATMCWLEKTLSLCEFYSGSRVMGASKEYPYPEKYLDEVKGEEQSAYDEMEVSWRRIRALYLS